MSLSQSDEGPTGMAQATAATVGVTVDYGVDRGASNQVASGFLHGIGPVYPAQYLTDGVKVTSIRGADRPYPGQFVPTLFDPATYGRVMQAGAPNLMVGLYYGHGTYFPGEGGDDFSAWVAEVSGVYRDAVTNGYAVYSWLPWNEPDLQWRAPHTTAGYNAAYRSAYQTIKALDPNARIQAPEAGSYSFTYLTTFLTFSKNNNCIPTIVSWHELTEGNVLDIEAHTAELQSWLVANGFGRLPLAVTEFQGGAYPSAVSYNPAQTTAYIAKMERSVVNGFLFGLKSAWNQVGSDPTFKAALGDTADASSSSFPRGSWWVYNGYKDATGRLVATTTGNSAVIDGLASMDSIMNRSIILLGNLATSRQSVGLTLTNLGDATFLARNGQVHIRMESYGTANVVLSPTLLLDADFPVVGNSVSLVLPGLEAQQGARLYISPATAAAPMIICEAELVPISCSTGDVCRVSASPSASAGGITSLVADALGELINFTIAVPSSGVYRIGGTLTAGPSNAMAQLYVNGKAYGGPKDEYATASTTFRTSFGNIMLSAGNDTLTFRVVSKNPANTQANYQVGFDRFTLTYLP